MNAPISHILLQTASEPALFLDEEDHQTFLQILSETVRSGDLCLYSYCLMPDHIHLLLRCPGAPAPFVYQIKKRYSLSYRRKYQTRGSLFRIGFREEVPSDPLSCLVFICRDPVRRGLSEDPFSYPWSGAGVFMGKPSPVCAAALFAAADPQTWRALLMGPCADFYMECSARPAPSGEELTPILRRICSPEEEEHFHYLTPDRKRQILGEMRSCSMTYASIQKTLNISRYEIDLALGRIRGQKK